MFSPNSALQIKRTRKLCLLFVSFSKGDWKKMFHRCLVAKTGKLVSWVVEEGFCQFAQILLLTFSFIFGRGPFLTSGVDFSHSFSLLYISHQLNYQKFGANGGSVGTEEKSVRSLQTTELFRSQKIDFEVIFSNKLLEQSFFTIEIGLMKKLIIRLINNALKERIKSFCRLWNLFLKGNCEISEGNISWIHNM